MSTDFIRTDRVERSELKMLSEFEKLRLELEKLRLEFKGELSENLRVQGFAIIGAVAALIAAATALVKFTP